MDYVPNENGSGVYSERKPNVLLGIIGSIIGAIIGAVIWVVLYKFGIIASLAGIAIIYLSGKGYALLSKSFDMKGVVISIFASILVLAAAHFLCWGMEIMDYYSITLIESIKSIPTIVFTKENAPGFFRDLAIGLVLIIVGAGPLIRQARANR